MNNKTPTKRYEELDALRGIAALMVVFFHFTLGRPEAKLGFKLGTTGVDLFFIISGFVIFMSLTRVKTSLDFVINRVSRLYPTYWTCVTFTFILLSINSIYLYKGADQIDFIQYLGNMTMFQFYLKIPDLDGPYWTMIIEMIFYIGIWVLFHFKLLKYLNIIGVGASILVVIITLFWGDILFIKRIINGIPLLQFIPLFFAGTLFYKIYTGKGRILQNYSILIICLVCQVLLFNYSGRSYMFISQTEYALMLSIYFMVFTLFVNGRLTFIVSKTTLFFGKISFALYLIHQYLSIGFIIPLLTNTFQLNYWIAALLIALPILIGVSAFITYYIEVPLSKKMKEKLRKKLILRPAGVGAN